ncbi:glycerophosphocholine phosphodiesterase GPCPD1-like isoform X2 [Macrosteles quadrilineatus]|uniref:glycerophosphocholine phosphodiesterase GPCPD1-like isoform X2 n=1 Tax=Macrosteles quadrilineatus TaxID=74068 RepID=UPI0023E18C30|nr:glycerophosphocholine phosphodiesterase GPCPD1-like isoform X2 [Macrosteles quadrilineatus]
MLRWWENDDDYRSGAALSKDREEYVKELQDQLRQEESLAGEGPLRKWRFRVSAETSTGETVCITGGSRTLGHWNSEKVLPMKQEEDHVWTCVTSVPFQKDVEYRYCVCIMLEPDPARQNSRQVIVRRWETNRYPRKIEGGVESNISRMDAEPETFGFYQKWERVERGWLTSETAIQIKLFNQPIEMWKPKLKNRPIYVKLTPVNLTKANTNSRPEMSPTALDETLSLETMDLADKQVTWPIVEVAVMNEAEREFHPQEQFGRVVKENDFIMFQILMHNPETVAYLMDFYAYGSNAAEGEPPYHVGFSYILPSVMKGSEGQTVAPITSTRQRPIGQITVEYLVVKPVANVQCDMQTSMQREWKETWRGLDVGHRGAGSSFKCEIKQCADVRENTIASLKSAASYGADFVEFDVQLSKDLVPVLYHDFYICISMKKKNNGAGDSDMLQMPVKDLTLEQLHLLKVYHLEEGRSKNLRFFDDDQEDHQPFPTLKQALEVLEPTVGFNIEIKWTMKLKDGTYELYHPFDLNLYLDTVLEVVLNHAGSRPIVFSCFHPDICSMIRLKQNKYPVMFLTQGITSKYPPYHDERCLTVPMAVHFAVSLGILGINAHTEDLLRDQSQVSLVKQAGLVLFCWGDDNNDLDTIKRLKDLGLHAIIYDKIDKFGSKVIKESIFRLEARESERCVIRAVAEQAERDKSENSAEPGPSFRQVEDPHYLNLDKAKLLSSAGSTSSCVSLWNSDGKSTIQSSDVS